MTELNPGIVKTVEWFNRNGFKTTDSGDGATHDFGCDRDYGYVVVKSTPSQLCLAADRIRTLLKQAGVVVVEVGGDGTYIQATYDPDNGVALIDVCNITDKVLFE